MTIDQELAEISDLALKIQANYLAILKAEKITMLTELGKEIIKLKSYESSDGQDLVMLADIGILLNQKIDSLKEGYEEC
jgi:hypothetical protein